MNFYVTALTTLAFAILTSALGDWVLPVDALGWIGIVSAGVAIAVGLLSFYAAFRYLGPLRATMLSNIEPLISILFAAAILGEQLRNRSMDRCRSYDLRYRTVRVSGAGSPA